MTTKAALFALLATWGVTASIDAPALAQDETQTPLKRSFTNRVWVQTGDGSDLPGVMKIFLSDGTLVSDNCWETHRRSHWSMAGDSDLSWNEDGMDIPATIVSVTATHLHLRLTLDTAAVDEHYVAAAVPYVCPDMPK